MRLHFLFDAWKAFVFLMAVRAAAKPYRLRRAPPANEAAQASVMLNR
ncbi:hypothetical protein [Caulobacter sp. BP25]|nr:hypothetical protein [Caulobacter sp. BP25]